MWHGACPASQSDRIVAMERELAFLELANRLRARLGEQRRAIAQLAGREAVLIRRLGELKVGAGVGSGVE